MMNSYLPIGSVCKLKSGTKRVMIIGFLVEANGRIYDYLGTVYPEGVFSFEQKIVFSNIDIENIEFKGYETEEQQNFNNKLNHEIKNYENNASVNIE